MSTDGNLPDLKFPQTGGQGNAIRLSASTLKQHGRNGESLLPRRRRNLEPPFKASDLKSGFISRLAPMGTDPGPTGAPAVPAGR